MPQELVFRGRLDTYTGFGQQFCPLVQFFIQCGFNVKVNAAGLDESFTAVVPQELKDRIVSAPVEDNEWEFQFLPLAHPITPNKKVIYFTMWETDSIGQQMVGILNQCVAVIVPCQWNKETFERSGVTVPIRVVPLGINKQHFYYRTPVPRGTCVFGAAGRLGHGIARKGVHMVMEAFQEAFPRDIADVSLRIKCFTDCKITAPKDRRVTLTPEYMDESKVAEWLSGLTAFVSAASGEGWGLWQHQALAVGRPVIACNYGGMAEFLSESNSFPLDYNLIQAGEHHAGYGRWAKPDMAHLVQTMQMVHADRYSAECKGLRGALDTQQFTYENTALEVIDVMREFGMLAKSKPRTKKHYVFRHSGDWGDIVWSLPIIRHFGGGTLWITEENYTRQRLTPKLASMLGCLLLHQPYIKDVKYGKPREEIDFDLDEFRKDWRGPCPTKDWMVYQCQAAVWGLDGSHITKNAWITPDHALSIPGKPVVVCRTDRYHNTQFPWNKVAEKYRDKAVFVGTKEEFGRFKSDTQWSELQHFVTADFVELARVIAGSQLFISNQGAAHAVAEALKVNLILEVCDWDPAVIFHREGVQNVWGATIELPDL